MKEAEKYVLSFFVSSNFIAQDTIIDRDRIKGLKLRHNSNWTGNWNGKLRRWGIPLPLIPRSAPVEEHRGTKIPQIPLVPRRSSTAVLRGII